MVDPPVYSFFSIEVDDIASALRVSHELTANILAAV
jgi:hypothetical protein